MTDEPHKPANVHLVIFEIGDKARGFLYLCWLTALVVVVAVAAR